MRKKIILIINLMAFGSLMATIFFNCGIEIFFQVLIPSSIVIGTNLAVLFSLPLRTEQPKIMKDQDDVSNVENEE